MQYEDLCFWLVVLSTSSREICETEFTEGRGLFVTSRSTSEYYFYPTHRQNFQPTATPKIPLINSQDGFDA